MNFEAISQMAKSAKRNEKTEKSQDDLRSKFELRFKALKSPLEQSAKEYEKALEEGSFEDEEGEEPGSGEKRKEEMQKKLTALLDRAEKMKAKLDSGEELSQHQIEITANYKYTNPKTRKVERQETITLDIEKKIQEFVDFYTKTKLDIPADFEDTIRDIWERNQADIQEAMEQKGFDDLLIIPGNIPLIDLAEKMKMNKGYFFYQVKEDFSNVVSKNVDKPRIILFHHKDTLPDIEKTTGLDIHLNITGADALKLYEANPESYLSTLEDSIILERKYFEDTGKHLSDYTIKSAQWLPGSKAGARLVNSYWHPSDDRLSVVANDLDYPHESLGVRPSRSFF